MSGSPRDDLFNKKQAPKTMEVVVVHSETVSCSNDHPKVFYKIKNNIAVCEYCSRRFIYVDRT